MLYASCVKDIPSFGGAWGGFFYFHLSTRPLVYFLRFIYEKLKIFLIFAFSFIKDLKIY